jgi:hypothetical protein
VLWGMGSHARDHHRSLLSHLRDNDATLVWSDRVFI